MTAPARWKRYPDYRPVPLDWSLSIPAHWRSHRLKEVASVRPSNVDKKSIEGERAVRLCNYVDVYKHDRITADMEFMNATATDAQIGTFSIRGGDVIITKDSESWDDIAVPAYVPETIDGVVCGYHLALIRPDQRRLDGAYLARCFAAEGLCDQFRVAANGITRYGLNTDSIREAVFPIPPLAEQRAIAAFLDRETARTDALVGHKERLIELLEEKRQAVINHAVTRGLNPSAPTKDSGIPWLGAVPRHWEVTRLKFLLGTPIEQGWSPVCDNRTVGDEEWAVLKVGCVNGHEFDTSEHKALPEDVEPDIRWRVKVGDVLMSRGNTRELVGSASLVRELGPKMLLCDLLYRFRISEAHADAEYVVRTLRSRAVRHQIEIRAEGASPSMRKISQEDIKELLLPRPPLLEQRQIASHLCGLMTAINATVSGIRDGITRLREYRSALISAAVTGQIDVRGAGTGV